MRQLASLADFNSHQVLLRPFSDKVYNLVLSANVEDHVTIPTGATRVVINGTAVYFCKIGPAGTTSAVPVADVTDGSGSTIQSAGYSLQQTDTVISCISTVSCIVSLEFYD